MSTELMHYAKGQKKKNAKYVDIVNGRYIYPEDLPRTQNRMRLKEERQDFYNIPKDYKNRSGQNREEARAAEDARKKRAEQIRNAKERSKMYEFSDPARLKQIDDARRKREHAKYVSEKNIESSRAKHDSRKVATQKQIDSRRQQWEDETRAKAKSLHTQPLANNPNITYHRGVESGNKVQGAYEKIYRQSDVNQVANKIGYAKNKVSREVNNILKEVAGNWEKFKQKTKKLSDQGKNLLASIFGWGK